MAGVHDDSTVKSSPENHPTEHHGFLQKIKDKLHIGHNHKSESHSDEAVVTPTTDSAVQSKTEPDFNVPATALASESVPVQGQKEPPSSPADSEDHVRPTDLSSLAGHESAHHGGAPTFLAALPDKDIPDEVTHETSSDVSGQTDEHLSKGKGFDSEEVFGEAQQGEHHQGVPTFLVALPEQDIPDEISKETSEDVTGQTDELRNQGKEFDSEDVFSDAQQGEHHQGVPTFLVALPDQDIPAEVNKETSSDVSGQTDEHRGHGKGMDSEEVFSDAQQGDHYQGVPTFLVALPEQDIPAEVTKAESTAGA